jgi:hypothetical protein
MLSSKVHNWYDNVLINWALDNPIKTVLISALFVFLFPLIVISQFVDNSSSSSSGYGLKYVKDARTNLCFAKNSNNTSGGWTVETYTNVPCNDQVLMLVNK